MNLVTIPYQISYQEPRGKSRYYLRSCCVLPIMNRSVIQTTYGHIPLTLSAQKRSGWDVFEAMVTVPSGSTTSNSLTVSMVRPC